MSDLSLQSLRLKNFKAIQDSGVIKFTPLTIFIGNNGSGKSSIIEGLEMLHTLVISDLDTALLPWHDFRYILNQAVPHDPVTGLNSRMRLQNKNPMSFDLRGQLEDRFNTTYALEITDTPGADELFIKRETWRQKGRNVPIVNFTRDDRGRVTGTYRSDTEQAVEAHMEEGISIVNLGHADFPYDIPLKTFIEGWQFISLVPQKMGEPRRQRRATRHIKLEKDGSNIAEYLSEIRKEDQSAFDGIVTALQYVLPYSEDLQIALTSELERTVYPQLTERNFKIPGWLLSTGTLRILALLALLRHPQPPPLIVIEEIENGLDPQSISLIISEIRDAIEEGKTQVIVTTHSPFLLDLVTLDHIVLVERVDGKPIFTRPGDNEQLQQWAESFSVGNLYTTGRLGK